VRQRVVSVTHQHVVVSIAAKTQVYSIRKETGDVYASALNLSSPSASPDLTFLPVFWIFSRTVSKESESAATTSAVWVSRETL
jgi:hypothetical protein